MGISRTPLRTLRAALFTALVVTLSVGSHVLLSSAPLPPVTVAALGAAVFVLAYALAGRERGFGGIAALLVPLELAADTLFTTGQHLCYGPSGGPVAGALRSFGVDVLCGGTPVGAAFAHAAPQERLGSLLASPDRRAPLAAARGARGGRAARRPVAAAGRVRAGGPAPYGRGVRLPAAAARGGLRDGDLRPAKPRARAAAAGRGRGAAAVAATGALRGQARAARRRLRPRRLSPGSQIPAGPVPTRLSVPTELERS
jgi:hypothetical protein